MQRDVLHFAAAKLQGGWSAADFGRYLNKDTLKELLIKYDRFEPLVRVRVLLSALTLDDHTKHALQDELKVIPELMFAAASTSPVVFMLSKTVLTPSICLAWYRVSLPFHLFTLKLKTLRHHCQNTSSRRVFRWLQAMWQAQWNS